MCATCVLDFMTRKKEIMLILVCDVALSGFMYEKKMKTWKAYNAILGFEPQLYIQLILFNNPDNRQFT